MSLFSKEKKDENLRSLVSYKYRNNGIPIWQEATLIIDGSLEDWFINRIKGGAEVIIIWAKEL